MTYKEAIRILKDDYTQCGDCIGDHCGKCMKNAKELGLKAIEKVEKYCWHDMRKNPEDLPEIMSEIVYIFTEKGKNKKYSNTARYSESVLKSDEVFEYIAWKYMEPFEEEEE